MFYLKKNPVLLIIYDRESFYANRDLNTDYIHPYCIAFHSLHIQTIQTVQIDSAREQWLTDLKNI